MAKPNDNSKYVAQAMAYYVSVFLDKKASPERRDRAAKIVLLGDANGASIVLAAKKRSLKEAIDRGASKVRTSQAVKKEAAPSKKQQQAQDAQTAGDGDPNWKDIL